MGSFASIWDVVSAPSVVILEAILNQFGRLGDVLETLGSPGAPKGGRVEKVTEKVVRGSFMGPPPGPPLEAKSTKKRETVVPRSTLENTVRKVLHRRCLATPSNLENYGFMYRKPSFSHFHL